MILKVTTQAMERTNIGKYRLSVFVGLLLLAHPIDDNDKKMRMHTDARAMKREILRRIPIGSPVEDAKRVMEANVFKCVFMENASFADDGEDGSIVTRHNEDFLWCDKEKRAWLLCLRRWQVIIVHENHAVTEVSVGISLACP